MIILIDLPRLSNVVDPMHPDMDMITVTTHYGKTTLEIQSTSSARDLAICKPTTTEWQTMLVLGPLLFTGVEVFSSNWG